MPARLFCEIGELAGSDFLIDREATIGRLKQNEITLHPTFISAEHARIYFDDEENGYVLEDLGSSNGTMLDGMVVNEPMRLGLLHVITFADQFDFIFQTVSKALAGRIATGAALPSTPRVEGEKTWVGDAFLPIPSLAPTPPDKAATPPGKAAAPPDKAAEEAPKGDVFETALPSAAEKTPGEMEKTHVGAFFGDTPPLGKQQGPGEKTLIENVFPVLSPLAAADTDSGDDRAAASAPSLDQSGSFELEVTMPDGTRHVFLLKEGSNVVGRESTRAITLLDSSVSRDHALVTVRRGQVFLKDLASKNGTFVEGMKLTDEVELLPETVVSFGREITASLRRRDVS